MERSPGALGPRTLGAVAARAVSYWQLKAEVSAKVLDRWPSGFE